MTFYCYILFSDELQKYYIGYTSDSLSERVRRHNAHHKGFTVSAKDWKLVYFESFISKAGAMEREKQIKKQKSKIYIQKLLAGSEHPDL